MKYLIDLTEIGKGLRKWAEEYIPFFPKREPLSAESRFGQARAEDYYNLFGEMISEINFKNEDNYHKNNEVNTNFMG